MHGRIQRGDRGSGPPLPKKSQKYKVSLQYWSGFLKNQKATKPAFNVGPSSARQRNAISMAFCLRADDGPIKAVFGSSIYHQLRNIKKKYQIWTPSDKTFWIGECVMRIISGIKGVGGRCTDSYLCLHCHNLHQNHHRDHNLQI